MQCCESAPNEYIDVRYWILLVYDSILLVTYNVMYMYVREMFCTQVFFSFFHMHPVRVLYAPSRQPRIATASANLVLVLHNNYVYITAVCVSKFCTLVDRVSPPY
jgi:hypothetical protein